MIIAETELIFESGSNGSVICGKISIEKPVNMDGYFHFVVHIPFGSKSYKICGEDSLQALLLAVSFMRSRLEDWLKKGNKIKFSDSNNLADACEIQDWRSLFGGF